MGFSATGVLMLLTRVTTREGSLRTRRKIVLFPTRGGPKSTILADIVGIVVLFFKRDCIRPAKKTSDGGDAQDIDVMLRSCGGMFMDETYLLTFTRKKIDHKTHFL